VIELGKLHMLKGCLQIIKPFGCSAGFAALQERSPDKHIYATKHVIRMETLAPGIYLGNFHCSGFWG